LPHRSIPAVFREQADALRSRPMVFSKQGGHWRPLTWAQMQVRVGHAAAGLCALDIAPGARVGLLAASTVEWVLVDLACASAGAVDVPIPETSTPATIAHILADAGCEAVFVGDRALLDRVIGARPPGLRRSPGRERPGDRCRLRHRPAPASGRGLHVRSGPYIRPRASPCAS